MGFAKGEAEDSMESRATRASRVRLNSLCVSVPLWFIPFLGDDLLLLQALEEVEEGIPRLLIGEEAGLAALRHVGHHLDLAAEIRIAVPGGGEAVEIGLG